MIGPLVFAKVRPRGMQDSPAIKTSTGNPGLRLLEISSRNAVHDVEVSVIVGEAVCGQNKAASCKTTRIRNFISLLKVVKVWR